MAKSRRRQSLTSVSAQHVPRPLVRPRVKIDRSLAWYAIKAAYNAEGRAELALRDAGFATYLPSEAVRIHRRGKLVEIERMPVSGYLFVGATMPEPDVSEIKAALGDRMDQVEGFAVRWRDEVIDVPSMTVVPRALGKLVCIDREPVRIGAGALQAFADECTGGLGSLAGTRSAFRARDRARITAGPWAGFCVDLERVACDHPIVALIDMMGRKVRVEVHSDQLERAA